MKLLVKILIAIAVLLAGAFALLLFNINPIVEKLKPQLLATVSEQLGHPVSIGSIDTSLFPPVSIELRNVSLERVSLQSGEEGGADAGKEASIEKLAISAELFALLRGALVVESIELNGLNAAIQRDSSGQLQVGPLVLGEDAAEDGEEEYSVKPASNSNDTKDSSTASKGSAITLDINSAAIRNSRISCTDESVSPAQQIEISEISADLSDIAKNKVGAFSLSATALGNTSENITASGSLSMPQTASGSSSALPKGNISVSLSSLLAEKLSDLAAAYGQQEIPAELDGTLSFDTDIALGDQDIQLSNAKLDVTDTAIRMPGVINKAQGVEAIYTLAGTPTLLGTFKSSKSELDFAGMDISLPLAISPVNKNIGVKTAGIELNKLAEILPALASYSLDGVLAADLTATLDADNEFAGANGELTLDQVTTNLAQMSNLPIVLSSGRIGLKGKSVSSDNLKLSVAGQPLDVKMKAEPSTPPKLQSSISTSTLALAPFVEYGLVPETLSGSTFENLNIDADLGQSSAGNGSVKLSLDGGSLAGAVLGKTTLNAKASGVGTADSPNIDNFSFNSESFGGKINATGSITEEIRANFQANALQLASLLDAAPELPFEVTGVVESVRANISTLKADPAANLRGDTSGKAINGEIAGINFLAAALKEIDVIPGLQQGLLAKVPEKYRPFLTSDSTQFDSLSYRAALQGKNISVEDFALNNAAYRITGQGQLSTAGPFNFSTMLSLSEELSQALALKEPKFKLLMGGNNRLEFPVKLIKKEKTSVIPDVSKIAQNALRSTAQEAIKKNIGKLDKIEPGLGKAIDSLFK